MSRIPRGEADSAGVLLPPPLIPAAAVFAGFLLERWRPLELALPGHLGLALGWGLILAALVLVALAGRELHRFRTTVSPAEATTALVTSGPYARTRNPLYVSLTAVQLGIGLATGNGWILLTSLPMLLVLHHGVVHREERYLERKFGEDYRRYRRRVRRWL